MSRVRGQRTRRDGGQVSLDQDVVDARRKQLAEAAWERKGEFGVRCRFEPALDASLRVPVFAVEEA